MSPWDPGRQPEDRFYHDLVMAAGSVLDVGCGTGAMLHHARRCGHPGRLVGLDPDRAALDRARRRADVEWIEGAAADAPGGAGFDLATMTGHAFQCLLTDDDLRASLSAIHGALRPGGRFAFETRHPQARAWQDWNPANVADATTDDGGTVHVWHEVDSVTGDVVAFHGTATEADGTVVRVEHATLRFLDVPALEAFLTQAGFTIDAQYGDWHNQPIADHSQEIITVARRNQPAH